MMQEQKSAPPTLTATAGQWPVYKAETIAAYFLAKDAQQSIPNVTQMKLHKLLYFAQANQLANLGVRLFDAHIEAFAHGPVVEPIRKQYAVYGRKPIVEVNEQVVSLAVTEVISEFDQDFLDAVWERFRTDSAATLRNLTHEDTPWKANYDPDAGHCLIPDIQMETHYQEANGKRRIHHPNLYAGPLEDLDDSSISEVSHRLAEALAL